MFKIITASVSDVGLKRNANEDSVSVLSFKVTYEGESASAHILAVADGMGGHEAGELASKIAVNTASSVLTRGLLELLNPPKTIPNSEEIESLIKKAFVESNSKIIGEKDRTHADIMGATMSLALLIDIQGRLSADLYVGHVGDTRVYLIQKLGKEREVNLTRLTKDHKLVEELIKKGELTEEQAKTDPRWSTVTRAVGIQDDIEVDTLHLPLNNDGYLLVCCDGLTDYLNDLEIKRVILSNHNLGEKCRRLISLAKEKGGGDNISVALLQMITRYPPYRLGILQRLCSKLLSIFHQAYEYVYSKIAQHKS